MNLGPINRFWSIAATAGILATPATAAPSVRTRETYQSIVERNPFGLKPPPVVDNTPVAPPAPPPVKVDVSLTGITTVGYPKLPKKAYFRVTEQNKKEPLYYDFSEGQGKDHIEVLQIDEKRPATVKIKLDGIEQTLTFESHGIKPPPTGPPQGMPGAPGVPGAIHPGGIPGQPPGFPPPPTQPQPFNQPIGQPQANNQPNFNVEPRTIPARPLRGGFDGAPQVNQNQAQQQQQDQIQNVDPAEQLLRMKAEEQYHKRRNIPYPPVPPLQ